MSSFYKNASFRSASACSRASSWKQRLAAVLPALLALVAAACGEKTFVEGRVYDFIARIGEAEVAIRGAPVDPAGLIGPLPPWTPDERLYCRALSRATLLYKNVPLVRGAVLHAGLGLRPGSIKPLAISQDTRIKYQVDLVADNRVFRLLDREIVPARLEAGEIIDVEIPLPEVTAEQGDFLFQTHHVGRGDGASAVWCGLMLVSEGRRVPAEEAPVSFRKVHVGLLDSPASPEELKKGRSFRADFDDASEVFLPEPGGRILVQEGPAESTFLAEVPREGLLTFGMVALDMKREAVFDMVFQIEVDGESVFEKTLSTKMGNLSPRIDLPLEGKGKRRITLRCTPKEKVGVPVGQTLGLWIYPVIEEVRRVPRQGGDRGKNILVLVVDALRADHLSCYGYGRDTTTHLDNAAAGGILFEEAYAQSSWTIPSSATLLTGQYAYTHGLYDAYHWYLIPGIATITESFQRAGFTTTAFVANHLISEDNNFTQGFETFHPLPYTSAAQINRAFQNWLDDHEGERFFAYLHYMEPHLPYAAPGQAFKCFGPPAAIPDPDRSHAILGALEARLEEAGAAPDPAADFTPEERAAMEELVDLYDSEIAYWDERFHLLLADLEARGLLENTLIVVTSDHGEAFLEHGQFRHGHSLYNELLQVPLILLNSGEPTGRRSVPVGLLDLAPTLLSLAGVPHFTEGTGPGFAGRNLLNGEVREAFFAETAHGLRHVGAEMVTLRAFFNQKWKGILFADNGELAVYDRKDDPGELTNLAGDRSDAVKEIKKSIEEWVNACRESAPYNLSIFDASAADKLREMGYIK